MKFNSNASKSYKCNHYTENEFFFFFFYQKVYSLVCNPKVKWDSALQY